MKAEDLFKSWEEERKWKEAHPFRAFPGEAFDFFRYRIPHYVEDKLLEVKWGFQRMFRGFDDRWYWSYYSMNAEQTLKILRWMKEHKHGSPFTHDPDNVLKTKDKSKGYEIHDSFHKRWSEALGLMIRGFEALLEEDELHLTDRKGNYDHEKTMKAREKLMKEWEKGARLFIANYLGLWD